VITAPEPYEAFLAYRNRCRTTVGVLSELFARARNRVIITAPFIQQSNGLTKGVLAPAVHSCLKRGVNVGILSTGISLQTLDRELLQQLAKGRLRFFQPSANIDDENKLGSHAKYCVADGESANVGSANLTSPGLLGQF
jgi:phosphatidylserine/phosphatidylglycerophosphate/cardiolipin synthase-like enzyme